MKAIQKPLFVFELWNGNKEQKERVAIDIMGNMSVFDTNTNLFEIVKKSDYELLSCFSEVLYSIK